MMKITSLEIVVAFARKLALQTAGTTEPLAYSCGYINCLLPTLHVTYQYKQFGGFFFALCGDVATIALCSCRAPVPLF